MLSSVIQEANRSGEFSERDKSTAWKASRTLLHEGEELRTLHNSPAPCCNNSLSACRHQAPQSSARAITLVRRGSLERREAADWLAGGEEESAEPKAIAAAAKVIFNIAMSFESAFANTTIPMRSSRAAAIYVDTPGASPGCEMIC